jgi:hypothetical protein
MRLDHGAVQPILLQAMGHLDVPHPGDVGMQDNATVPTHENLTDWRVNKTKKAKMASIILTTPSGACSTLVLRCWSQ